MTADELRDWLQINDYTPRELAHELGVFWTSVYRWLDGKLPIRPVVVLALEQLAGDTKAAARRRELRWTTVDLRKWMLDQDADVADLSYALDLPERAIERLLSEPDDKPIERAIVLALMGVARDRRMTQRPKGMGAEDFRKWMKNHRRTQKDVVEALGVSEGAVSRWASVDDNSHRGVSPMTRLALKSLERRR